MDKKQSASELLMIFVASGLFVLIVAICFKQMHPEAFATTQQVLSDESTNLSWDISLAASRTARSFEGDFSMEGTRQALERSIGEEDERLRRESFGLIKQGDLLRDKTQALGMAKR
jgi:hypothetical protein